MTSSRLNHFPFYRRHAIYVTTIFWSFLTVTPLTSSTGIPDPKVDFTPNQTLPSYALEYAPYVYLHSQELYWPADIPDYLTHVQPEYNFSVVPGFDSTLGGNCQTYLRADQLSNTPGQDKVFLTSKSDVFKDPKDPW